MTENRKMLSGQVSAPLESSLKQHVWGDPFGQPAWLNNGSGNLSGVCKVCGCELLDEDSVIQADQKMTDGRVWVYRDALGREIRSFTELSCPVFAGLGAGTVAATSTAAEAKEVGRAAKAEAQRAQDRVSQIERRSLELHASIEARITQLEQENLTLRTELKTAKEIDITQLARKLIELAQEAKEQRALEPVTTTTRVVQIPRQLREVIDVVGIPIEEMEPSAED